MKRLYLSIISLVLLSTAASAQAVSELYRISQQSNVFSTARVSAMGGAFTSLGADVSSIGINPAGISMFKGNGAFAFTPSLGITSATGSSRYPMSSSASQQNTSVKTNETYGGLANIGFVYNQQTGDGAFKNIAFGFNYSSVNNSRSRAVVNGQSSNTSILDMFSEQLYGVNPNDIAKNYGNYSSDLFGAIGAFHTGLIFDDVHSQDYQYKPTFINDAGQEVGTLLPGDIVDPQLMRYISNQTNDYNFAISFNINDILHIGTTIGYSEYNFKQFDDYYEYPGSDNKGDLYGMLYGQELYQNGSAFNFIFGATVQPIKNLRIGASIQTPKTFRISEEYSSKVISEFYDDPDTYESLSPVVVDEYKIQTPTRFNTGISYAFGKVALLSVDYERIWYNKMKYKNPSFPELNDIIGGEVRSTYKPTNNLRAGLEIVLPGNLSLRGGYAYYENADRTISRTYGEVKNISGGIGYRAGGFSIDLSYVNSSSKVTPFSMYSYSYETNEGTDTIASSSISDIKLVNHNVFITFAWRL